jgi:putative Mn2+ efflux pump MntP
MIGVKIGNVFGSVYKSKAEFTGGLILILMGFKILLSHVEIIGFR